MEPKPKKFANLYKSEPMRFLHLRVPESLVVTTPSKAPPSNLRARFPNPISEWLPPPPASDGWGMVEVRTRLVITDPPSNFRETLHVSCEKTCNLSATDPLNYSIDSRTFYGFPFFWNIQRKRFSFVQRLLNKNMFIMHATTPDRQPQIPWGTKNGKTPPEMSKGGS